MRPELSQSFLQKLFETGHLPTVFESVTTSAIVNVRAISNRPRVCVLLANDDAESVHAIQQCLLYKKTGSEGVVAYDGVGA